MYNLILGIVIVLSIVMVIAIMMQPSKQNSAASAFTGGAAGMVLQVIHSVRSEEHTSELQSR